MYRGSFASQITRKGGTKAVHDESARIREIRVSLVLQVSNAASSSSLTNFPMPGAWDSRGPATLRV